MKQLIALFCTVTLLCTASVARVSGQVVAIGHVTAEVVESVSASSKAITGFSLKNGDINSKSTINGVAVINSETFSLGAITINSGTSVACNLVVHPANLSDNKGNGFTIDPTMNIPGQGDTGRADGTQTIQINGTARMRSGQASGLYQGSYTMVFAYN